MAKLVEKLELDKLSLQQLDELLKRLEEKEFALKMVDTWTSEDYKYSDEIHEQIMAVKKEIIEHEDAVYGLGI